MLLSAPAVTLLNAVVPESITLSIIDTFQLSFIFKETGDCKETGDHSKETVSFEIDHSKETGDCYDAC